MSKGGIDTSVCLSLAILHFHNADIPDRPETEHLTSHLFSHISSNIQQPVKYPLRILDLCSGSGCIPLHLYSLLSHADIPSRCLGIDISHAAITLAQDNIKHNIDLGVLPKSASEDVQFRQGNILLPGFNLGKIQRVFNGQGWGSLKGASEGRRADIVVSNPPYISSRGFNTETARSVRNYEPKLALVPPREGYQVTDGDEDEDGDIFYPVVSSIAKELSAKILLVEVGGWEQAERVKAVWQDGGGWGGVAVWMDYSGKGRGVVAWKKGWEWVEEGPVVG